MSKKKEAKSFKNISWKNLKIDRLKTKYKLLYILILGVPLFLLCLFQFKINQVQTHFDSKIERISNTLSEITTYGLPTRLTPTVTQQENDAIISCSDEELHVGNLPLVIRKNRTIMSLLRKECLWLHNYDFFDLDNNGTDEIFLETSGMGCGSCHVRFLYILSGDNIIFDKYSYDGVFRYTDTPNRFEIVKGFFELIANEGTLEKYEKNEKDGNFYMYGWTLLDKNTTESLVTYQGYVIHNSTSGEVRFRWYDTKTQKPTNPYGKTIDPHNEYAWFWAMPKDVPYDEVITDTWIRYIADNKDSVFKITGTRGKDDCAYFDSEHCIENIDIQSIEIVQKNISN